MARLGSDSSIWSAKIAIAVDGTALGSPANKDVEVAIPATLEAFWDNVDANGYQIRVTTADGITLLEWGRTGTFSKTNRTGGLKILGASGTPTWQAQVATNTLWLYVGNASITTDAASATATSSPLTGYLSSQAPVDVIQVLPEPPGRTAPLREVSIKTTEAVQVWFDVGDRLGKLREPTAGSDEFEELSLVNLSGLDDGGAATVWAPTKTKLVYDGGMYVRCTLDASGLTSGDVVTALATFTTTSPEGSTDAQTLEQRLLVRVLDPDDQ